MPNTVTEGAETVLEGMAVAPSKVPTIEHSVGYARNGHKISTMFDTVRNTWAVVTGNPQTTAWVISVPGAPVEIGGC